MSIRTFFVGIAYTISIVYIYLLLSNALQSLKLLFKSDEITHELM